MSVASIPHLISSFVAFCPFHIVHLTEFKESQLMMFLRICPYAIIILFFSQSVKFTLCSKHKVVQEGRLF